MKGFAAVFVFLAPMVVLIAFFLPWVEIYVTPTTGGQTLSNGVVLGPNSETYQRSGFNIARGKAINSDIKIVTVDADGTRGSYDDPINLLFGIPILSLISLGIAWYFIVKIGSKPPAYFGIYIAAHAIGYLLFYLSRSDIYYEKHLAGFYATRIGLVVAVIAGIVWYVLEARDARKLRSFKEELAQSRT